MKASEFVVEQQLDEGPIDFIRKVGAGLKSLGQGGGFKSGYVAKRGEIQRGQDLKTLTLNDLSNWGEHRAVLGRPPVVADIVAWAKQYYKDTTMPPTGMPFEVSGQPASLNNSDVSSWISQLWRKNYTDAVGYTPPPGQPELSFTDTDSTPPDNAKIPSNRGEFTYKARLNKWVDSAGTLVDNPAIEQKLNDRWEKLNQIVAVSKNPDRSLTINTNKGQYSYNDIIDKWYEVASRTEITDPRIIQRLNDIAAQQSKTP